MIFFLEKLNFLEFLPTTPFVMLIETFWNKAIEDHSLSNNSDTAFVSISQDSLNAIFESYLEKLNKSESDQVQDVVHALGGIANSYYESIKCVFFDHNYKTYSFLKFSFFVLCAFETDSLQGYWNPFDERLAAITPRKLYSATRKVLIDQIINNLKSYCYHPSTVIKYKWRQGKDFLDINIYGEETTWVNVGRIYAHSIFTASGIEKVKKAMYKVGYAYSRAVEYLTDEEIFKILEEAELPRIGRLFQNNDIKGLVRECLCIWLRDWEASEEEEISYKSRSRFKNSENDSYRLSRIWHWDRDEEGNCFNWVYGFISKENLGTEGFIQLNEDNNIRIDLGKSVSAGKNSFLYIVEGIDPDISCQMQNTDFNLKFELPDSYSESNRFALKSIKNISDYYLQSDEKKIIFSDEKVLFASRTKLEQHDSIYCGVFRIKTEDETIRFYIYRIKTPLNIFDYKFIKVNSEIDLQLNGITAGLQGTSAFLSTYPVTINFGNISDGFIEVYNSNDEKIHSENLSGKLNNLDSIIYLNAIRAGKYKVKIRSSGDTLKIFKNGNDYREFEIVDEGLKDRRVKLPCDSIREYNYHKFNAGVSAESLDPDWILLFAGNNELLSIDAVDHKFFDFCFVKNRSEWVTDLSKSIFFAAIVKTDHARPRWDPHCRYLTADYYYEDTDYNRYNYKARPVCRGSVSLAINPELYISSEIANPVFLNCYRFELISADERLQEKYPDARAGKTVDILSNYRNINFPENLLLIVTQEVFPFKF